MNDVGLAELVQRIAVAPQPDDEAELCRRFVERIRLYGRRHLRDPHAEADLVQEVMFSVLQAVRAGRVENADKIANYVLGACRHTVWRMKRNDWRRSSDVQAIELQSYETDHVALDVGRLEHCLGVLPERDRQVVYKSFYEEQSSQEIGSELGTSEGNIRIIRFRALSRLRTCIEGGAS